MSSDNASMPSAPWLFISAQKETCGCVFCEERRKPRPVDASFETKWSWVVDAAELALRTVGTPITECTNQAWVLAIDLAAEVEPRRENETQEAHRSRLGTMIKRGKFR